jgi:ankyrin repeat protein
MMFSKERYAVSGGRLRRAAMIIFMIGIAVVGACWFVSPVSERAVIDHRLISAISSNSPDEAILAIYSGADPNVRTYFRGKPWRGLAALGLAGQFSDSVPLWVEFLWPESGKGHFPRDEKRKLLAVLLEHGANVNEMSGGRPILSLAVLYGFNSAATELIAHGADTNLGDFSGGPPLVYAVDADNADAVSLLVQHGAVPGWVDSAGGTLIIRAVNVRANSCVDRLFGCGIDLNAEDSNGKTALDYAVEIGSPVAAMLRTAGGHSGSQRRRDPSTSAAAGIRR